MKIVRPDGRRLPGAVHAAVSGRERSVLVIECYPGVDVAEIERQLVSRLQPDVVVRAADALKGAGELEVQFADTLGNDLCLRRCDRGQLRTLVPRSGWRSYGRR